MKRVFLAVLITVVAFSASSASPAGHTNKVGTASFQQVKKKSTKKAHKKPAVKKSSSTKKK